MMIIYINTLSFFFNIQQYLLKRWESLKTTALNNIVGRMDLRYGLPILSWAIMFHRRFTKGNAKILNELAGSNYTYIFNEDNTNRKKLYSNAWGTKLALELTLKAENQQLVKQMRGLAAQLDEIVEQIEQRGKTPIFSPLHMCSDMMATMVSTMAKPCTASVVSIYKQNNFGNDEAFFARYNIYLHQVNPLKASMKLARVLRSTKKRNENTIIYADALPQCTYRIVEELMPTKTVTLFGRQGRLHSGIDRLASMVDAEVIFFYLYWEKGELKLRAFSPVETAQLTEKTCEILETALHEKPEAWILWHIPNLFYFNAD